MEDFKLMLDNYMEREICSKKHKGLSLGVFRSGEELFFNYGETNQVPITEKNYFEIASTSKVFTSLLILSLESRGLISTNEYIEKYIFEFAIKEQVLISDLLSHTAGLSREPNSFKFIAPENSYIHYSEEMLLKDVKNVSINPDLKGKFSYSNYGYLLLGLLAKRVMSEVSIKSLIKELIIDPLGLTQTVFDLDEKCLPRLCVGHDPELSPVSPYLDLGETFSSAGALITTTEELLLSCKWFLLSENVCSELREPIQKMFEITKDRNNNPISAAFHVRFDRNNDPVFYHPGNIAGHKCSIVLSKKNKKAIVYNTTTLQHVQILWDLYDELQEAIKAGKIKWAKLLKRVFSTDIEKCTECGGRLRILAAITKSADIKRILTHVGIDPNPPPIAPAKQLAFDW